MDMSYNNPELVSGVGQFHTNEADLCKPEKRLTPYGTIDLEGIRALVDHPQSVDKAQAQWFIPSSVMTRHAKTQEAQGQYWMMWADLDQNPQAISDVMFSMRHVILGVTTNLEIYTSRSATIDKPKSRILIPLDKPLSCADWRLCQEILNDELQSNGMTPDRAAERPAQLCYLPNRGDYYGALHQRDGVMFNPLHAWHEKLAAKLQALCVQALKLEADKKNAQARAIEISAFRATGSQKSLIDAFNDAYSVAEILIRAGYDQRGETFRHPASESGGYSASVKEGRVHALSSADPLYTGGSGGGAHDAFSAFEVLFHKGLKSAAMKDAGDNWLKIGAEPWNKVVQREFMLEKAHSSTADFANIDPVTGEVVATDVLPIGTEQCLAEEFALLAQGRFRWTPGMGWMVNKGTYWCRDELLERINLVKSICRRAASRETKAGIIAKLCSASTTKAVISLACSCTSIATPVSDWDCHPMLLNTPDEVIDLRTGRAVSRDGLLFTQITEVSPKRMPIPLWDKFIDEVFSNDGAMIEFIQRMGGYALTGSIQEQKLFFLHGTGANGKSVFLDVLRNLGGAYSYNLPSEALMSSRNEGHPTMYAALQGKRLAISSEIEDTAHWAASRIKSLTGDETLTARRMRQDFTTFKITHKHVIAGNFKPRLKGDDFAMARRMVLVPFAQCFEGDRRDTNLPEKLKAQYPGILYWFTDGARKWAESGLAIPASVQEASREYMDQQNDVQLWLDACCQQTKQSRQGVMQLYQSFSLFKQVCGENPPSVRSFSQSLERIFKKIKTRTSIVFQGVQLIHAADFSQ